MDMAIAILQAAAWAAIGSSAPASEGDSSPQSATQPQWVTGSGTDSSQEAPLLRETSQLIDVMVEIERDQSGSWIAVIQRSNPTEPPHRLALMPGTRLAELQRLDESSQAETAAFRLSGQIYVYRDKNYLLPTQVAVVSAAASQDTAKTSSESGEASPQSTTRPGESSAQRVLRELDERAGPRVSSAGGGGAEHSVRSPDASPIHAKSLREGVVVTNRRGKLTRDSAGAWVFVFDADAHGQADPPMKILPCLLLERMEDYARRVGGNAPAILNGAVYLYGGQNYLLPTMFLIPQERRNISP